MAAIVEDTARRDIEMLMFAMFPPSGDDGGGNGLVVTGPCSTSWRSQAFPRLTLEVAGECTTDSLVHRYIARFLDQDSYLGAHFKSSKRVTTRHLDRLLAMEIRPWYRTFSMCAQGRPGV